MTIFVTGLSMGITVLVGKRIGKKNPELAGRTIGSGICFFITLAVFLTAGMVLCASIFTNLLDTPAEAYSKTVDYIKICGAGAIFIVAYNVIGSIFRGIGDAKTPLIVVSIASIVNIAGDLLLVAVFYMGAAGAAIATVAVQYVSVLISIVIKMKKQNLPFHFTRKYIRFNGKIICQELKLGIPVALQDTLTGLAFLFITLVINSFGSFIWLFPSSLMQSMSVFVAQNFGAGKTERIKKILKYGLASAFVAGVVFAYLSCFHGDVLAMLFNREVSVVEAAQTYMYATGLACLFSPMMLCFTGYYNGCGKTLFVMVQGLLGTFLVRIPTAYIMSQVKGGNDISCGAGNAGRRICAVHSLAGNVHLFICF